MKVPKDGFWQHLKNGNGATEVSDVRMTIATTDTKGFRAKFRDLWNLRHYMGGNGHPKLTKPRK